MLQADPGLVCSYYDGGTSISTVNNAYFVVCGGADGSTFSAIGAANVQTMAQCIAQV
jgi:hypothetical protein